ncbi:hydrogenase 3 maturation endopeptidase HyCI [bacterium]|nr:MAG: hydrogenase 3 maturation endopeptidase HyCI [bacterium]
MEKCFKQLKAHLKGKVVILGIGNSLKSDDGAGPFLAKRIKDKHNFLVFDAGTCPENYLGKVIKEKPDTVVIIDAADFGGTPGELRIIEAEQLKSVNLFSTHNASISLTANYLQSNLKVDIIILIIQPKTILLGEQFSPEVTKSLSILEDWFSQFAINLSP